jgi:flagellar biosynthesis/type III secretory pathway protein FliH
MQSIDNFAPVNRIYKSRLFTMLFSNKKELLELYNATSGTHYTDPELLQINTLENAIYMTMQNDLSFIIDSRLSLYEHQSTYNPNLPLRYLMYVSDLYSAMTKTDNLYGRKLITIPTPKFIIFYNGIEEQPDMQTLRLSDMFETEVSNPALELEAVMLNINPGHNSELLNSCKSLRDYSEYTARVRKYAHSMDLDQAVELAITECINEGILKDFLQEYRAEAKKVSIYEYDQERHMQQEREAEFEMGFEAGREAGEESGFEKGRKSGEESGVNCFSELAHILLKDGKTDELMRATEDKEYRDLLFLKYNL